MTKLKLFSLLFLMSAVVLGGVSQRHAIACEFVEYSRYSEIAPNIFVSPSFSGDSNKLLSIINSGKSRVDNTFGAMVSSPIVIVTTTEDEASTFGSNAYGRAHLTPLGECLVFGPKGQNIDVIAHEYTHSEVHFRVGWLQHYLNVPIWFNEGISLLVDFREPYLMSNIELTPEQIEAVKQSGRNFFSIGNVIQNYQAARVVVDGIDKSQLYDNLRRINQGEEFINVFSL